MDGSEGPVGGMLIRFCMLGGVAKEGMLLCKETPDGVLFRTFRLCLCCLCVCVCVRFC